jgi:hypothetical protein
MCVISVRVCGIKATENESVFADIGVGNAVPCNSKFVLPNTLAVPSTSIVASND